MSGDRWNENLNAEGADAQRISNFNRVSPQFFQTMETPLLAGRDFKDGDTASSPAGRGRLLFGLRPNDPVTLGMAIAMLGVVAMFASYLPALRAARVDPMAALRDE